MRELNYLESALVAGGDAQSERQELRELFVDSSLAIAPFVGYEMGTALTVGMGLGYGLAGGVLGAYGAIIAIPVVVKVGLELAFGVHDVLV